MRVSDGASRFSATVCVADIRRSLADLLEIASVNLCICRRAGLPTIPTRCSVAMETCYLYL